MRVLLVVLAGRRYGVPLACVDEVVPRTRLEPIAGGEAAMAGLMDHRGTLRPVVDGALLLHGVPSPALLGSRIVVMTVPIKRQDGSTATARFGLLCDIVIEQANLELEQGAWRPDDPASIGSIVGAVGRFEGRPLALIDPMKIASSTPLLAPSSEPSVTVAPSSGALEGRAESRSPLERLR